MINFAIAMFFSMLGYSNEVHVLPRGNWSEDCRRMTGEDGSAVSSGDFLSLKGGYSASGMRLIWTVSSFKDKRCFTLSNVNRFTYQCEPSENRELGKFLCTQIKWESSSNSKTWRDNPMVDREGRPDIGKIYFTTKSLRAGKIQLTVVDSESEDSRSTNLSRTLK